MARPIALQLYTVREELKRDFWGVVRQVAEMGYEGVQISGFDFDAENTPARLKQFLDEVGLQSAGRHVNLERLERDLEGVFAESQALKDPYIVCPFLPEHRRRTVDDWRATAELFNRIGAACRDRGFIFGYHNHAFEFEEFDGRRGLDILIEETDPELVTFEIDTYWVQYGGGDPVDYIRRCAGRVPLVHLKDMTGDERRFFAEVGEGILDWDAILPACEEAGVQWYIVEQDRCERSTLESVRISLENLRRMLARL
jgi:sugar phosphate isomerase/epimerase